MPPIPCEPPSPALTSCLPGFIDGEDGAGNIINGGWREDEATCGGLESLGHSGGNRSVLRF